MCYIEFSLISCNSNSILDRTLGDHGPGYDKCRFDLIAECQVGEIFGKRKRQGSFLACGVVRQETARFYLRCNEK